MNKFTVVSLSSFMILFSACSTSRVKSDYDYSKTKSYSSDKSNYNSEMDKKTYSHPTMRPYVVRGIRYEPTVVTVGDTFKGKASWYGPDFQGKFTSNGEVYNMYDMTAAHKTLPMNTIVKVTNLNNGLQTVVRINDRGPFVGTRIIDLSKSAADKIHMVGLGTALVNVEVLGFETSGSKVIPSTQELKSSPHEKSVTGFALQIASFSKIEGAIQKQSKYDNTDGYRTIMKDLNNGDATRYKVWLKGFKSEAEARDYKSQGHFKDAFIVVED